ncbi:hypothetical protein ACFZCP_09920 [Streptomyces sp. NPDC007971]|uniref:hypothetical protein n=1 Tax=Streptomyces sp. NPDC007971 TaxID=3364799 RepID=UPI0036E2F058
MREAWPERSAEAATAELIRTAIQRGSTTVLRRLLIPATVLGAVLLPTAHALTTDIGWDVGRPIAPSVA